MRRDVEFKTQDGVTLRGWHYLPDQRSGKLPTIVMAHGFSAVKEMYLDKFAEVFAAAGLGALVFDNRNFGASGGEFAPGNRSLAGRSAITARDAITFAEGTLPETDRRSDWYLGIQLQRRPRAGPSGAIDRRVKCVAGQVPLISGHNNARRLIRADFWAGLHRMFDDDRRNRYAGKPPAMIPVVAEDPNAPSALPTPDSWSWFTETGRTRAPSPALR